MIRLFQPLALALLAVLTLAGASLAEGRMIIVMDGSGSMWGQIDGRAKLEIARDAVRDVLANVPAERDLGLYAYGHRRKGDCDDIELVVPPAQGSGPAILSAVQAMRFLGKTPLTRAVRLAAEALRYTEEEATVVLVTDGLETCEADPCALGAELEQLGLKFTAHVIGFGLTREEGAAVACLAENTGGQFIRAADAKGLTDALDATVNDTMPDEPKTPAKALPGAGLTAPDQAPIGARVDVTWSVTEPRPLDTIVIGAVGSDEAFDYVYADVGNPAVIQMPGTPGPYELRYVSADEHVVARRPITVIDAPVALDAPDQALVGQLVPIHWTGPDAAYDNVRLRLPGDDSYISYSYVAGSNPVLLTMPDAPGDYELTYVLNDTQTMVTRPIAVLPAGSSIAPLPASLSAPDQTEASSDVQVGWSGPGAAGDYILLRSVGSQGEDYVSYAYVAGENPVTLATPGETGDFELVYRFADGRELASRPITIVTSLSADSPAVPAGLVDVSFEVPPEHADLAVVWSAVPRPGQPIAPEAWALNDAVVGPVSVSFEPGTYDVTGSADGMAFAGTVTIRPAGDNRFVIGPTQQAPETTGATGTDLPETYESEGMGEDTGYFCEQTVPCAHEDAGTGLAFLLPGGWHTDFPYLYETAGGATASQPSMTFYGPPADGGGSAVIVLNPRQWLADNGPCADSSAGQLCRFDTDDTDALTAFEIIKASLRLGAS
ncbi:vWA domain-containing protein [Devosia aquimaris]|uniref:vWA domain-containing protein n=1 Tax=Devosia aquimaris TaxID=2866214 RepID=UPI001CD0D147|nr:VWA domain-containing protein [Devosia sp. CJK-A8-3]